jgi:G3E family GTPase
MQQPETLPVTVLTGFLGSGKTTLLRRALRAPSLADTAVVINELGAVALDHYLVDFVAGDVVELPGGCLCCAVREDLARTLRDLLARRAERRVRPFSRLVVETTGLADPAPILYTFGADPDLDHWLRSVRVVTLVDALAGAQSLDRFPEAARQVALADALVISKTDLAPAAADLTRRLETLNPGAERITGCSAADPGAVLFAPSDAAPSGGAPRWGLSTRISAHTHGIDAFAVTFDAAISRFDFARALGGLAGARGNDLLRVKGIVEFADRPGRPAVVQAAQHTLSAPEWLDDWPAGWPDRRSRLVFVVHEIPRPEILGHFAAAAPSPWPAPQTGG